MKIRTSIAATAAVALIGAGAFMLPAAASAGTATHTLRFISLTKATTMFTQASGAQQETDVNAKGKVVGFDMSYYTLVSNTTAGVNITVDTTGGMLYVTGLVNINTNAFTGGKVTGGTGAFKGATGTVKAKNLNKAGTRTAVTITYHK